MVPWHGQAASWAVPHHPMHQQAKYDQPMTLDARAQPPARREAAMMSLITVMQEPHVKQRTKTIGPHLAVYHL